MSSQITKYIDILLLSETRLDDSFPTALFSLNGFSKPYRLDRGSNGGSILLYVRDDIPSRLLTDYKIKEMTHPTLPLWFFEKCIFYREGGTLVFCDFDIILKHLSFLKISLNFLRSFRRYEEILCQY